MELNVMYYTLLTMFAILATIIMVSTTILQQVDAAPKEQKYTVHQKSTYDPAIGEYTVKGGSNDNGPLGHEKCKWSYDSSTGEGESTCK